VNLRAAVDLAIRDERVQQLLAETDIRQLGLPTRAFEAPP
jgi:hypothetical protein